MAKEGTATVKRTKAKQEGLPGIQHSDRRIAELEDLGDELADLEDEMAALKYKVKDANENLVAAMRRREKTYYSRTTWSVILLTESAVKVKVKKAHAGGGEADE